ncbi:MAG: Site-specific recombinase [uncultured bacterium]|nr:MAG: Site-specific recombinase [uncultured bacterium]
MKVNKTKTAYAYLRVGSRHQIAGGTSINQQKEEIKKYCRDSNIRLVDVFEDCPESANNFNRRGFVRMLGKNVARPVDLIIATSLDRISRDCREYLNIKYQLAKLGTRFFFLSDSFSFYMEEIMEAANDFESRFRKRIDDNCDCVNG